MFKWLVILFLLFGSLALGFYLWNQADTALNSDISVKGIFHEGRVCDNTGCSSTPYVTFKTKAGSPVKMYPFNLDLAHQEFLTAFYDESTYHDGQVISVLYNPSSPDQAFIASSLSRRMDAIFWFILGTCILLGMMAASLRQGQRPAPGPMRGPAPGNRR